MTTNSAIEGATVSDALDEPRRKGTASVDLDLLPTLLGYRLRRAQIAVFHDFMQTMAEEQVTPGQFGVLTVIGANPGLSQTAVAEALGSERSAMVAILDRLERRGLVVRRRLATDRRTYALSLTGEGEAFLRHLKNRVRMHENRIAARLDAGDRKTLVRLLGEIGRVDEPASM